MSPLDRGEEGSGSRRQTPHCGSRRVLCYGCCPVRAERAGRSRLGKRQQCTCRFLEKRVRPRKVSQHPGRQRDRGSVSTCCLFWESEIPYSTKHSQACGHSPNPKLQEGQSRRRQVCFPNGWPCPRCQHHSGWLGAGGMVIDPALNEKASELPGPGRAIARNPCPAEHSEIKLCISKGRTFNLTT